MDGWMNSDIWNRLKEPACGQSGHYCCEPLGPLFLDIAGCLHPVVTRWQCSGALKNPSVSVLCVLVQRLDRVLWLNEMYSTASGQTCCQYFGWHSDFHASISFAGGSHVVLGSVFHWNYRNRVVYNKASPFPQAQNRHRGQLNYGMSVCVSAMTVYLTWSGCGLNPTAKNHLHALLSPEPICCPRFVVDVVLCP